MHLSAGLKETMRLVNSLYISMVRKAEVLWGRTDVEHLILRDRLLLQLQECRANLVQQRDSDASKYLKLQDRADETYAQLLGATDELSGRRARVLGAQNHTAQRLRHLSR